MKVFFTGRQWRKRLFSGKIYLCILAGVLSASLLFSLTGCSKKDERESETKILDLDNEAETPNILTGEIENEFLKMEQIVSADEVYYQAKEVSLPENPDAEFSYIHDIKGTTSNIVMLSTVTYADAPPGDDGMKISDYILTILDENADFVREINLNTIVSENVDAIQNMSVVDNNEIHFLVFPQIGKNEGRQSMFLYRIDLSGNLLGEPAEIDLGLAYEFLTTPNGYIYICSNEYDSDALPGKENYGAITVFDMTGQELFQVKDGQQNAKDSWVFNHTLFADNNTVYVDGFSFENQTPLLFSIDTEKQILGENIATDFYFNPRNIQSGSDGIYYTNTKGIHRLDMGNVESREILSWEQLDIIPSNSNKNAVVLSEDRIFLQFDIWDANENDHREESFCYILEKQAENPHAGKKLVRIGGFDLNENRYLQTAVYRFNQTSPDFRMEIIDYSNISSDSQDDQIKIMNAEFLSGNVPDILYNSRSVMNKISFRNYASKNILIDLLPLMEADTEFARSDYFENLLFLPQINENLYYMFPEYEIGGIVGKTERFGQFQDGWTQEEFEQAVQSFQDPSNLFGMIDHATLLERCLRSSLKVFVDDQAGTANFETDEFRKLMEFSKKYSSPPVSNMYGGAPLEGFSTPPVNTPGYDMGYYYQGLQTLKEPDSSGITVDSIENLRTFLQDRNAIGESLFITGYPLSDRSGPDCIPISMVGIASASLYPEAGWEFIKILLSEELQLVSSDGLKINKGAFEELLTRVMTWHSEVESHPLPQEAADMLRSAVLSVQNMDEQDTEMIGIVMTEAQGYFAGQKSLDETIGVIQSRAMTLMNER